MKTINKVKLDKIFNLFVNKIEESDKDILWKLGVYSKNVKKYLALEQGKLVENFLRELMGASDLDTDEKSVSITGTNGDYRVNSGIDVNVNAKSIIQRKGVVLKNGNLGSKQVKVFDLSRNTTNITVGELLERIGYEEVFHVYAFDVKKLKGRVFITSLSEMGKEKLLSLGISNFNEGQLKKSIESLFKFNGSSHYLINSQEMINTARLSNRVYSFEIDKNSVNKYVNEKIKKNVSIFDEIK
jgi:hypothetical protein